MQTFFIDTFTGKNSSGNPTVVCVLEEVLEPNQYLHISQDFKVPVTAFVDAVATQGDLFSIRYFTATNEIPACGHATLAAAKVLFDLLGKVEISFHTSADITIKAHQKDEIIFMQYPVYSMTPYPVSSQLLHSLKLKEYLAAGFCDELETLFIELESVIELRHVQPDYQLLMSSSSTIKEVVLTSASDDDGFDYVLRSFCPWIGIDEDPVTGSVHSVLAAYWAQRFNKTKLRAFQASAEAGELLIEAAEEYVWIGGRTTIIDKPNANNFKR